MQKSQKKRIVACILQQILALVLSIVLGVLALDSVIVVNNMYGEKITYRISPFDTAGDFLDSVVFHDMFRNVIIDIERFSVIKEQLESNGEFDPAKVIDVTEFINQMKGQNSQSLVSADYELEKLIKWNRYGMEMQTVTFQSKFDFLTYFGYENLISVIEDDQAYAAYGINPPSNNDWKQQDGSSISTLNGDEDYDFDFIEEQQAYERMEKYISLVGGEDMLYQAIVSKLEAMDVKVEEQDRSGQTIISLQMLDNRYETTTNQTIKASCKSWEDYYLLETNVMETIRTIGNNYDQYQKQNDNYAYGKTNVLYYVENGSQKEQKEYYSNMPSEIALLSDADRTAYFEKVGKYIYFSPDEMIFKTNTGITEKEMLENISDQQLVFSEDTRIWICVNGRFTVMGDLFYQAQETYKNMISNVWAVLLICGFGFVAWFIIWIYISCYTGKKSSDEKDGNYLYILDKIPLEIIFVLFLGVSFAVWHGFGYLKESIVENSYNQYEYHRVMQSGLTKRYLILIISASGFFIGMFYTNLWYSVLRRWRMHFLWQGSALQRATRTLINMGHRIGKGRNMLITRLMPYNIFILFNIWSVLWLYDNSNARTVVYYLIGILLLLVDVAVGWWFFQRSLERLEILEGAEKIGQGNIDFEVDTSEFHGENVALGEAVNHMGEGIRHSVAKSLKDERMKTDLITNVSHDIKTPLTSIINYVNLLKRENITQEPAMGYIQVLDAKSQRLKQLTDDLVEASKISSGNIVLHMEKINLTELVRQSLGEFEEKFEEKKLIPIFEAKGSNHDILADSRRMWRVVENLLNNVAKYALAGTRVYISVFEEENKITMEIKNVSENALNIKPEELTERFIRGDVSRSTEGSGLGLSIVKGLVEVQKGDFRLEVDGDLFKAYVIFERYEKQKEEMNQIESTESKK